MARPEQGACPTAKFAWSAGSPGERGPPAARWHGSHVALELRHLGTAMQFCRLRRGASPEPRLCVRHGALGAEGKAGHANRGDRWRGRMRRTAARQDPRYRSTRSKIGSSSGAAPRKHSSRRASEDGEMRSSESTRRASSTRSPTNPKTLPLVDRSNHPPMRERCFPSRRRRVTSSPMTGAADASRSSKRGGSYGDVSAPILAP